MKIVSDNIKNVLKEPTTQRKGRILIGENYYEVYNVEYYADAYLDGNVVGNAIASQLDFDLPYIPKFETFKYFDGVWTGSNYEYVDMGTFHVFDEQDEDEFNKHITAFDNLIKFNVPFNDVGGYPKTLFQELQNVCNQAGINLQNMSIANGDFQVVNNQFVNGESLKAVLKAICQISGTYAIIKNDKLVLQLKNETDEVINKSQHQPVTWKRKTYGINQVVLGVSDVEGEYVLREDTQDIAQNGVHKLVINDNPFAYTQAKRDELIDDLFNQVRGFGYVPYEMNCEWLNYLEIGDIITIDDIETIVLRISGKSPNSLESFISAPAIIDSSVAYVNNTETVKNQLKRTEIIVDKNNQSIQSVVEQTEEQNQKIAHVTQTVEELNSKISDIADITTSAEDTDAKIEINEVNESEPIRLIVKPIGESISNLVISSNMLISDNMELKQRIIRFTNIDTNEIFDYELPDDLWYYDSENYDEFILDYDGQSCVINKKVGINADGTIYVLQNPITVSYPFPTGNNAIILTEGDYNIEILGHDTGYLFARLMAKNIYTTQFYTKAETDSIINQTSQSIDLSVNKKLSNYSTTTQMNSAIQLSASSITSNVSETYATKNELNTNISNIEQTTNSISLEVAKKVGNDEVISTINQSAEEIKITGNRFVVEANNFKLTNTGDMTATSGTIGGFTLDDTSLSVEISETFNFTEDDLNKAQLYILGQGTLTDEEKELYDINGDGIITSSDLLMMQKCIVGIYPNQTITGKFKISSNSINKCIEIEGGSTAIGLNGITSDRAYLGSLNTPRITVQDFDNPTDRDNIVDIQPSGITVGGNCLVKGLYSGIVALGNNDTYMHVETSSGSKGITWWDSDRKLKTNIKDSNVNALDVIKQIKHREYDRTDRKEHSKIGYVAQELQGIDESLVFEVKQQDGVKILNINQPNLIPYLTKAIQEQQEIIEKLENKIKEMESEK